MTLFLLVYSRSISLALLIPQYLWWDHSWTVIATVFVSDGLRVLLYWYARWLKSPSSSSGLTSIANKAGSGGSYPLKSKWCKNAWTLCAIMLWWQQFDSMKQSSIEILNDMHFAVGSESSFWLSSGMLVSLADSWLVFIGSQLLDLFSLLQIGLEISTLFFGTLVLFKFGGDLCA